MTSVLSEDGELERVRAVTGELSPDTPMFRFAHVERHCAETLDRSRDLWMLCESYEHPSVPVVGRRWTPSAFCARSNCCDTSARAKAARRRLGLTDSRLEKESRSEFANVGFFFFFFFFLFFQRRARARTGTLFNESLSRRWRARREKDVPDERSLSRLALKTCALVTRGSSRETRPPYRCPTYHRRDRGNSRDLSRQARCLPTYLPPPARRHENIVQVFLRQRDRSDV